MNNEIKKAYIKPDITLVDFSLSSSIASTCSKQALFAQDSCGVIEDNGWIVYADGIDQCIIKADDSSLCYHVPTDDSRFFSS